MISRNLYRGRELLYYDGTCRRTRHDPADSRARLLLLIFFDKILIYYSIIFQPARTYFRRTRVGPSSIVFKFIFLLKLQYIIFTWHIKLYFSFLFFSSLFVALQTIYSAEMFVINWKNYFCLFGFCLSFILKFFVDSNKVQTFKNNNNYNKILNLKDIILKYCKDFIEVKKL